MGNLIQDPADCPSGRLGFAFKYQSASRRSRYLNLPYSIDIDIVDAHVHNASLRTVKEVAFARRVCVPLSYEVRVKCT